MQTQTQKKCLYTTISKFGHEELAEIDVLHKIALIPDNHVVWVYKVRKSKAEIWKTTKIIGLFTKSAIEAINDNITH